MVSWLVCLGCVVGLVLCFMVFFGWVGLRSLILRLVVVFSFVFFSLFECVVCVRFGIGLFALVLLFFVLVVFVCLGLLSLGVCFVLGC